MKITKFKIHLIAKNILTFFIFNFLSLPLSYSNTCPELSLENKDLQFIISLARDSDKALFNSLVQRTKGEKGLGEGSFGQILPGTLKENGLPIAIKIINFPMRPGSRRETLEDTIERRKKEVAKEYAFMKHLSDHPNFLKTYGFSIGLEEMRIIMERAKGSFESLHLNENFEELIKRTSELSKALQYMHEKGVFHLDLKPDNILIGQDGALKIIDLGSARKKGESNGNGQNPGTAGFMAPEVTKGGSTFVPNEKCDVFSLGVTIFKTLKGRFPMEISCQRFDCQGKEVRSEGCELGNSFAMNRYTSEQYGDEYQNLRQSCSESALPKTAKQKKFDDFLIDMIHPDPQMRPDMKQVVHFLKELERE